VGPLDEQTSELARALDGALPTTVSPDVRGAHWTKLIVNLNNALAALTGLDSAGVLADPALPRLSIGLMREGVRVAEHAGIGLASVPGISATQIRLSTHMPVGPAAWLAARKARTFSFVGPALGSTLQSLKRRQPTEIDYLNGEVVRVGRQVGVPTPLNARTVELVHELEQTGQFLAPAELARLLRSAAQEPIPAIL